MPENHPLVVPRVLMFSKCSVTSLCGSMSQQYKGAFPYHLRQIDWSKLSFSCLWVKHKIDFTDVEHKKLSFDLNNSTFICFFT